MVKITVTKCKNDYIILFPQDFIEKNNIHEGDELTITLKRANTSFTLN